MSKATIFQTNFPPRQPALADGVVLLSFAVLLYGGLTLTTKAPSAVQEITLAPSAIPRYALYSVTRMLAAYVLSMLFTLVYGRAAAYNRRAERVLLPLLDVLQSVPILSFLPVALFSLSAIFPLQVATELAAVTLIFTSQVWNMTFAWYQSLTTIPKELREASAVFRFNTWMNFKNLELPFAAIPLIWNSMMSWAGGWFFLMAAEIFTVGQESFRLPGLGAYLQTAAFQGDLKALAWGLGALIVVIVVMDQWIWHPLLTWSDRFKLEMTEGENPPTSWFYTLLRDAHITQWFENKILAPIFERTDMFFIRNAAPKNDSAMKDERPSAGFYLGAFLGIAALAYGTYRLGAFLFLISLSDWTDILVGIFATALRVFIALAIAMLWTIPVGYVIGSNPKVSKWLQPLVQVAASLPATALFPVLVAALANIYGGLNLSAILLMLMGTQWYLLFNVIAGASSIPQDLKYTTALLGVKGWERWRTLILPSLFPFIVTGLITAGGGAWNASIVAEYIQFGGKTLSVEGIGAVIAAATTAGDYPLLLFSTLSMILAVVLINRFLWRRLYRSAEERFKME